MPALNFLKSGVHRVACFALYRALLRRGRAVLPNEHGKALEKHIKKAFRTNAKVRSLADIRAAFDSGYSTLEDLSIKDSRIVEQLTAQSFLSSDGERPNIQKKKTPILAERAESEQPRHPPRDDGRRWPFRNAKPVLNGLPSPPTGKRRRVPTLVNANHIPFLRFKKPQSPYLSYIIRTKNVEREKRIAKIQSLEEQLFVAEEEDEWDRILQETNNGSAPEEHHEEIADGTSNVRDNPGATGLGEERAVGAEGSKASGVQIPEV
ncbi:MAG: hypothetical protein Q9219_000510 [cf. Caloplaca sp. 3 TL-2023]